MIRGSTLRQHPGYERPFVHVRAAVESERSLGVLYCDNPKSKKFIEDDLEVFAALCNYAAVAIEQSRLTSRCRRRRGGASGCSAITPRR